MLRYLPTVLLLALFHAGCASTPEQPPLSGDPELDAFVRSVEQELEAHAWQALLAKADPGHYRAQVVEHGMPEPQYVAELFGLHRVDNNIKQGSRIQWSDLERIETVEVEPFSAAEPPHSLAGTVTLADGSTLRLQARVTRVQGRYVLTGGLG